MIDVYHISGAPRSWRVLLAFVAKGLPFELKQLEVSTKQHKQPAFLALNPRGRVPVIVDDGFVLSESLAILSYLEKKFPEPPLFGVSEHEHGRIWQRVSESHTDLHGAVDKLLGPIFFKGEREVDKFTEAAQTLHEELAILEAELEKTAFLASATISAADVIAFPEIRLVLRAIERFPELMGRLGFGDVSNRYQNLIIWTGRIEALPGYARTFPSHWKS